MDGEVGLARAGQRVDLLVPAQRLQGVPEPWRRAAVVDQQRRAAVGGDAQAQRRAQRRLRRGLLEHRALRGVGQQGPPRRVRQAERQSAFVVQTDHLLGPAGGGADELARGQAVQQLVADQQQGRAAGHGLQGVGPADLVAQPRTLKRAQRRRDLDQPHPGGFEEGRGQPGGAQQVAHQRSVARAHFD